MRSMVLLVVLVVACSAPPSQSRQSPPPTPQELEEFCAVAAATIDLSRQERMTELQPVTPGETRGSVKRASELQSTIADDNDIDRLLDQCD